MTLLQLRDPWFLRAADSCGVLRPLRVWGPPSPAPRAQLKPMAREGDTHPAAGERLEPGLR